MRVRLLSSFVLMFALALPALAQDRRGGSSLDRVLPHVRQTVPGTFYDAEGPYFGPSGHPTYRLKWMTPDGRIIWFGVDAETGRVLGAMPSGPPPGRYRDEVDRGGWGNRSRDNWPDNDGGVWGNGGGRRGDRGGSWGDRGSQGDRDGRGGWSGRGGNDSRGQGDRGGWSGRGGNDSRSQGDRGGQSGWGGRGGGNGGGHSGQGGHGGGPGGNDRGGSGGRHRSGGG